MMKVKEKEDEKQEEKEKGEDDLFALAVRFFRALIPRLLPREVDLILGALFAASEKSKQNDPSQNAEQERENSRALRGSAIRFFRSQIIFLPGVIVILYYHSRGRMSS